MLKLIIYIPATHLEQVKQAIFTAGAGQMGHYQHCSWQTKGQGQFMPLNGSEPFIGQDDKLSIVEEYRLETVCDELLIKQVVEALKQAHPYEEPAFDIIKLYT